MVERRSTIVDIAASGGEGFLSPGHARSGEEGMMTQYRSGHVMGGCCGTDHRHIEQIAIACA